MDLFNFRGPLGDCSKRTCLLTRFGVLCVLESWLKYFFKPKFNHFSSLNCTIWHSFCSFSFNDIRRKPDMVGTHLTVEKWAKRTLPLKKLYYLKKFSQGLQHTWHPPADHTKQDRLCAVLNFNTNSYWYTFML